MMKFDLIYSEPRKLLWVMIIVPLFWAAVFILAILQMNSISDWLVMVLSVSLIAVGTLHMFYIIKKWVRIKCEVIVNSNGMQVLMKKKSPLYNHQELNILWSQIQKFKCGSFDATIILNDPYLKFNMMHDGYESKQIAAVKDFVAQVNLKVNNM